MKVNEVNQLLSQMRALTLEAQAGTLPRLGAEVGKADFAEVLNRSIDAVNGLQQEAGRAAAAFERGDPGVDIAGVMLAMQKASLGFQAMSQVRNRLVSAYQDIMNMPV